MSRSGYVDDCDHLALWRGTVTRAIRGKRGQAFLRELAAAMDAMPEKVLIADELINENGDCCAIGVVCKARGLDVSKVDYEDPESVGNLVGIARSMAAEIEYENDESDWPRGSETPEKRWERMRRWVDRNLIPAAAPRGGFFESELMNCPTCKNIAYTISEGIAWCPRCGTLVHPEGDAWFQAGSSSTPRLVEHVRESLGRGDGSYDMILKESVGAC